RQLYSLGVSPPSGRGSVMAFATGNFIEWPRSLAQVAPRKPESPRETGKRIIMKRTIVSAALVLGLLAALYPAPAAAWGDRAQKTIALMAMQAIKDRYKD